MSHINIQQIPSDDEVGHIIHDELTGPFQHRYVTIDDAGTCLPDRYSLYTETIENFEVRNDDIWVCTFPRSGTTWTQEMVWMIANELDYDVAKVPLLVRFPYLENNILFDMEKMYSTFGIPSSDFAFNHIGALAQQPSPRFIKSHLPFHLLPQEIRDGTKTPKIFYVTRNPKDVCVSLYHLYTVFLGAKSNLENFSKVFLAGKVIYGLYFKHVFGFWAKKEMSNIMFINYEDMKKDLRTVIKKVAGFLNKNLTDDQIKELEKHLSFESMKQNDAVNNDGFIQNYIENNMAPKDASFIRSGTIGKHKDELSPETIEKFNEWIKEHTSGTAYAEEFNKFI